MPDMKTNSPRRDARIRIAVYFVLTAASFILLALPDQGNRPSGLYVAATFALFYGPLPGNRPKRSASERGFWWVFFAAYLAIPGCYFFFRDAPMPLLVAAALCIMALVFSALQWREVHKADDEQLRRYFEAEKWPGG